MRERNPYYAKLREMAQGQDATVDALRAERDELRAGLDKWMEFSLNAANKLLVLRDEVERLKRERDEARAEVATERERGRRLSGEASSLLEAVGAYFDPPEGRRRTWPMNVYAAHRALDDAIRVYDAIRALDLGTPPDAVEMKLHWEGRHSDWLGPCPCPDCDEAAEEEGGSDE